jgi:hypothetical protein
MNSIIIGVGMIGSPKEIALKTALAGQGPTAAPIVVSHTVVRRCARGGTNSW